MTKDLKNLFENLDVVLDSYFSGVNPELKLSGNIETDSINFKKFHLDKIDNLTEEALKLNTENIEVKCFLLLTAIEKVQILGSRDKSISAKVEEISIKNISDAEALVSSKEFLDSTDSVLKSNVYSILGQFYSTLGQLYLVDSQEKAIGIFAKEKLAFEKSLELNSSNSLSNMYLGVWYFMAPEQAGGSAEIALDYALRSIKYSNTNNESYWANIWVAQIYFKLKDISNYELYMNNADKIYPNGYFHKLFKQMNENGGF